MADKSLVLVTGASGFVGKWTVIELLRAGYRVRGTLRTLAKADGVRATVAALAGEDAAGRLDFVICDLMAEEGWAEAMQGVGAVVHVATQILGEEPKDPDVVIRPAVDGTERVLRFAHEAGISRVVITSSIATVGYGLGHTTGKRTYTEADYTNLDAMRWKWAYCIGKTLAERAAWTFAANNDMQLTTVHPGMILGPAADADTSISLSLVSGLMDGTMPAMPSNGFCVIDVRDVAAMHVAALEKPEAIGQRYLATGPYLPFPDVAKILRRAYPGHKVTIRTVPDWIIRLLAFFGGPTRQIINDIGNEKHFDGSKGRALLGRDYRSPEEATLSAAESLIRLGLIKTTHP
ncbi:MAG: NAD-dependent epimerase/dehydratase family protein [Hyphomicrobiales bacterium]|nr:NAD-dependent epimerase/dehydratase family protein [Hyphomicrobiales bacterium]